MQPFGTTAQEWSAKADDFVNRVGDVADQIASATRDVSRTLNTPIAITTPTPHSPARIGLAIPVWLQVAGAFALGYVVLRALTKGSAP